jgi:probable H4MPT-linked C1 transfer pathway protein
MRLRAVTLRGIVSVIGWDIGGVNTKAVRVAGGEVLAVRSRPYELQRAPAGLVPLLRALASDLGAGPSTAHAVTMTAELSQMFRTKREGVTFVIDAVEAAFPSSDVRVFAVDGRFLPPDDARREPLAVAAANWAATAHAIAAHYPDALLIDVGTTTADIIPIVGGAVAAAGWTDPARLASGELVYTGALRTPVEAIVSEVPYGGAAAAVSAEGFALAGDVHVWRGTLDPGDYTVLTPDGRPPTPEYAGERIARVVCGDRELLDDEAISIIADAVAEAQVARIAAAIERVVTRHPSLRGAVVTGLGASIGAAAARAAGLTVTSLAAELGDAAARCAPAAAVALLGERTLDRCLGVSAPRPSTWLRAPRASAEGRRVDVLDPAPVDLVLKLGGSLLAHLSDLDTLLATIVDVAHTRRLLIVPGGGPFADTVRDVDRRVGLPDDAAHWMAVLAMDQSAHLLAARLPGGIVVTGTREVAAAFDAGRVPVLAPSPWLSQADPLPHAWDVTSDSIAAWVAGQLGARDLVIVKAPGARGSTLVDAYFARALDPAVTSSIVPADQAGEILRQIGGRPAGV